jgi:hypothetical protein
MHVRVDQDMTIEQWDLLIAIIFQATFGPCRRF